MHMGLPLFTGPMLPETVRTPFSLWNFSNSFLNLGTVSRGAVSLLRLCDFPLRTEVLCGLAGSRGDMGAALG